MCGIVPFALRLLGRDANQGWQATEKGIGSVGDTCSAGRLTSCSDDCSQKSHVTRKCPRLSHRAGDQYICNLFIPNIGTLSKKFENIFPREKRRPRRFNRKSRFNPIKSRVSLLSRLPKFDYSIIRLFLFSPLTPKRVTCYTFG